MISSTFQCLFGTCLLTVETMDVSRKINRDARVRLSSINFSLMPVTGSVCSAVNDFSGLTSGSAVWGGVSMAVRSDAAGSSVGDCSER